MVTDLLVSLQHSIILVNTPMSVLKSHYLNTVLDFSSSVVYS